MFSWILALTFYTVTGQTDPVSFFSNFGLSGQKFLPSVEEQVGSATMAPRKIDANRLGLKIDSRAAAVIDWNTGQILFGKNFEQSQPIASITKLAAVLVFLEIKVPLNKEVEIFSEDMRPGGVAYLAPGEKVKVIDLLNASLVASANGATASLVRASGITMEEFVSRMNALAKRLGMHNTKFVEPTGLDVGNMASAQDVALLVRYALQNKVINQTVLKDNYEFDALTGLHHVLNSTDLLLESAIARPPYKFLGGKTGFLDEAGYCFGAAAQNGRGDKVVAVVLGAPTKQTRFDEVSALMYWTFDAYTWDKS